MTASRRQEPSALLPLGAICGRPFATLSVLQSNLARNPSIVRKCGSALNTDLVLINVSTATALIGRDLARMDGPTGRFGRYLRYSRPVKR